MRTSTMARDQPWVLLPTRTTSPLRTNQSVPLMSRTWVTLKPIASTVPEASPRSITSPMPYWSSTIMNKPERKSLTRGWAPKHRATPAMPAEARIAGVALGFGAQTLVKDFLSGLFMMVEDQYGIGDVIDLGEASGTVEAIGLRVTQVRDINGTLWFVRNGEVVRVGNKTQGWSRAIVEVRIDQTDDIDRARQLLLKAAQE